MNSPFAPEHMQRIALDGVWRPKPWFNGTSWQAVRYTSTKLSTGRAQVDRQTDDAVFRVEQTAQMRCDELNATREGVSASKLVGSYHNRLL